MVQQVGVAFDADLFLQGSSLSVAFNRVFPALSSIVSPLQKRVSSMAPWSYHRRRSPGSRGSYWLCTLMEEVGGGLDNGPP